MKFLKALRLTPREKASSELFRSRKNEWLESALLARIPIRGILWRQEWLSLSQQRYPNESGLLHSDVSLMNTAPTWVYHVQVTVTSNNGVRKESFCGTQSQVAERVHRFLITGQVTSGMVLLPRSCSGSVVKASYSPSSDRLPDASSIWSTIGVPR